MRASVVAVPDACWTGCVLAAMLIPLAAWAGHTVLTAKSQSVAFSTSSRRRACRSIRHCLSCAHHANHSQL